MPFGQEPGVLGEQAEQDPVEEVGHVLGVVAALRCRLWASSAKLAAAFSVICAGSMLRPELLGGR